MSKSRASIFEDSEGPSLDVTAFGPKTFVDTDAPQLDKIREVSKAAKFTSREPAALKQEPKKEKRPGRRYRTGRNVQFNVKALAETVDTHFTP